mgnify:CR=1 FL=1
MRLFVLLIVLSFGFSNHLMGLHIIGGEMTYECLSPGQYEFTLTIYRDCAGGGASFDNPAFITVYQEGAITPLQTLNASNPFINTLTPQANNPCIDVPPGVCVQEGLYTFRLSLPVSDQSYFVVYQRCCRNVSINNIVTPGNSGSTYGIELTPLSQTLCNSSPVFEDFPPPIICVNEPLDFSHMATDADGDELIYEFCSPLLGGTNARPVPIPASPPPYQPVQFLQPLFNPLNPVGGLPPVSINSSTGLLTGLPNMQGQYVVGICVSEYRNGQLLSTVQRDFQFNIALCDTRISAELDGVEEGGPIEYLLCGETEVDFINQSFDEAYIREYLWQFYLPGRPDPVTFDTRDVSFTFPSPGSYRGQMILNPGSQCTDTAQIRVQISPEFEPVISAVYDTCVVGPVAFSDRTPAQPNLTIVQHFWEFGDGQTSELANPVHQYVEPGSYPVRLTLIDEIGCTRQEVIRVDWFPVPPAIIFEPSSFVGCPGEEITFTNLSFPIDETYENRRDIDDKQHDSIISTTHLFEEAGIYSIFIEITSPLNCYTSELFPDWIEIDSFPIADFSWAPVDDVSNFMPTVMFQEESTRAVEWEWQFGEFGETIGPNPTFTFPDTGRQEIQLIVTHPYLCQDTIVKIVDVTPKITFFMPNAFTPNSDGKNEVFGAVGFFRGIRNYEMIITDRWGGAVFRSQDPETGWNGRVNNVGSWASQGVYTYQIRFMGPRGKPYQYRGFTTLLY